MDEVRFGVQVHGRSSHGSTAKDMSILLLALTCVRTKFIILSISHNNE